MKTIAIIPAKGNSLRCPHKNLREFMGLPLFLHSAFYARNEGVEPIVSTDSEEVASLCRVHNLRVALETVDDSTMANCVRQVLAQAPCEAFAILQPTSPFRKSGLLQEMLAALDEGRCESAFTARDTKPIGLLDGHFRRACRDQDTHNRFLFFDGNISVATRAFFERGGELFDDASVPFANSFPCTLQIDTEEEFAALRHLSTHADFLPLLPSRVRRVCIVSNRPYFERDYSAFIDSCDVVIRVSKMGNLDTGLTGCKTDMAVVSCWQHYMTYSRAERHVEELCQVPYIYFVPWQKELTRQFACSEGIQGWAFLPPATERKSIQFTTFAKAVVLGEWLFPEAELFCLADMDVSLRCHAANHINSGDNAYLASLVSSGRMTCILEDGLPEQECRFSCAIPPEKQGRATKARLRHAPASIGHETVRVRHRQWSDDVRLAGKAACRVHRDDDADVLFFDGNFLSLKWDKWGTEHFQKEAGGSYVQCQECPPNLGREAA